MITRALHDVQAACIALILMLVPGVALSQDQKEPVAAPPGVASETSAASATHIPFSTKPTATATAEPTAIKTTAAPEGGRLYTIKKGDTLWDLSNTFMKDPFLWPFIWKANPAITNPDLIYPGNNLTIPDLTPIERALSAPAEQKEEVVEKQAVQEAAPEKAAPEKAAAPAVQLGKTAVTEETGPKSTLLMPEERPIPLIDKYAMIRAGFVDEDQDHDVIAGSPMKDRSLFSFGQTVYVKMREHENIKVGDKFLIYAPLNDVRHPITNSNYGKLIRGLGVLQITAKDSPNVLTAKITISFDAIEIGNHLTPYQEPAFLPLPTETRAKDISGYILEVTDKRKINGQTDFVYLDKGSADGVEAGDRFAVYQESHNPDFPRNKVGEVQVFLVKERTSTAVVRKSTDALAKGDMIDYKK